MNDDRPPDPFGALGTADHAAPAQQLGLAAVGDRCVSCGAPLSSDQRYCVNCGERRSRPRFSLPEPTAVAETATRAPAKRRRPRGSEGGTVVAGIGTLLLAMGVGVLIGRTNAPAQRTAATPKVQVVQLGGGSGSAATTAASNGKASGRSRPGSKGKSSSKAPSKLSAATAAKANAAASKVLGAKTALPPPTVTVGATGSGPGYQKGHFTGTFFGH